jgi:hypothetical protein
MISAFLSIGLSNKILSISFLSFIISTPKISKNSFLKLTELDIIWLLFRWITERRGVKANYFARKIKESGERFIPDKSMWFSYEDSFTNSTKFVTNLFYFYKSKADSSFRLS